MVQNKFLLALGTLFVIETLWRVVSDESFLGMKPTRKQVKKATPQPPTPPSSLEQKTPSPSTRPPAPIPTRGEKEKKNAVLTPLPQAFTGGFTKHDQLDPSVHHWYLGVCASTAVSSEWLREWIELQMMIGVSHVWVVDDNKEGADDETGVILEEYEVMGYVTVLKGVPKYHPGCGTAPNCISPKYCWEVANEYVDWLIFADTDEFMYPSMGCDLASHVMQYCDHDEAYHLIRWERFGTSGHYAHPEGLMTENFLSSGGDCTNHHAMGRNCFVHMFDYCLECRHTKVMYNTAKCVNIEHVGHPHNPANTTYFKRHPELFPGGMVQKGDRSIWRDASCTEMDWEENRLMCISWLEGDGSKVPPKPSSDCCTAGIGYNHYGTKSKSKWDQKMKSSIKRGYRPSDFSVIEQNSTVSYGVLKFARALRKRFTTLGQKVSPTTSFIDIPQGACFAETGWIYVPVADRGTVPYQSDANTTSECCAACWDFSKPGGRCGGWSFHPPTSNCTLIYSPFTSWRLGADIGITRWPHASFTGDRLMDSEYTSGMPLYDGECHVK